MPRQKQENKTICPVCGKEFDGNLIPCNFEQIMGRASWDMSFNPKMNMCRTCSDLLLAHIEKWFSTTNKTNFYKKDYVMEPPVLSSSKNRKKITDILK